MDNSPRIRLFALLALFALAPAIPRAAAADSPPPALRGLMVAGGCCHDYEGQTELLTTELSRRVRIDWEVVRGPSEREVVLDLYREDDWAEGFDVVVHNECYGSVADVEAVERIARAHFEGTPAVVIHCSMHSYRAAATDAWRQCLGVTSRSHEGHRPLVVTALNAKHPILTGFPHRWQTPNGELYKIEKSWPNMTPLATAWGADTKLDHVVVWTNTYGEGRTFGTTIGHHTETMRETVYLDLIARGLLWACGKLEDDGSAAAGYAAEPPAAGDADADADADSSSSTAPGTSE